MHGRWVRYVERCRKKAGTRSALDGWVSLCVVLPACVGFLVLIFAPLLRLKSFALVGEIVKYPLFGRLLVAGATVSSVIVFLFLFGSVAVSKTIRSSDQYAWYLKCQILFFVLILSCCIEYAVISG
jgi:hypothetical protein